MNKLYVCIYLLPLETSSHPPSIPPHWVITEHWAELHALYSSFLLASYFTHGVYKREEAMAPHSNTLAWKIPWMEEPGRLHSMGSLSQTWLRDFTFTFHFHALEKEMAIHSSILAWRISGTGEPGELLSMGSHRVGHDWSYLAAVAAAYKRTHWS